MTRTAIENEMHTRWLAEQDEIQRREVRDEFAKIAINAMLIDCMRHEAKVDELLAADAYHWADLMMAARDKPTTPEGK